MSKKHYKIFGIVFWKEEPGVIGPNSYWCAGYSCYLHICDSLPALIWEIITKWKNDRHLAM